MRYVLIFLSVWCSVAFAQDQPYVVLVSFDGFRHDYVEKFDLPNFKSFIKKGAAADALIPSFPSKTFPNHYTLVTGLYPGNHGLVDNQFYDAKVNARYAMGKPELVRNPVFYGGTPLWQLAQQQGLRSASCFWVGSEAPILGEFPTYYYAYDHDYPNEKRIDRVMDWLRLPQDERPHFISLYFSLVDTEGHNTGPNSEEMKQTTLEADRLLGYLMDHLNAIKLPVNVILVSDHGMMEMKQGPQTWITLSKYFNPSDPSLILVNSGTHAHVYTSKADSLYTLLKRQEENFVVYKRTTMPVHWHYNHDRVGDLIILAQPGFQLQAASRNLGVNTATSSVFGVHGYDPYALKDMHGIFYAMGPNIKPGARVQAFENVHVYPFVARLLGLKTPHIDGDSHVLESLYKK